MRFLVFASLCSLSVAVPPPETKIEVSKKAASLVVNYGCQCDKLTFRDDNNRIHGNCKSVDETGAQWCYLTARGQSSCSDIHQSRTSARFPGRVWSYEACATPAVNNGGGSGSGPQIGCGIDRQGAGCSGNFGNNGVNDRAASQAQNLGCQCHSLTFKDKLGRVHGNCKSVDKTGALWCYLAATGLTTCSDIQQGRRISTRFKERRWSYEACATPAVNNGGNGNFQPQPINNGGNNNGNFGNNGNNGNFGNNGNNGNFGNNGNSGTNCRQGSGCTGNFVNNGNNGNFGNGNNGNFGNGNNGNFGNGNNNGVDTSDRSNGGNTNVAFGGATSSGVSDRSKTKSESAINFE